MKEIAGSIKNFKMFGRFKGSDFYMKQPAGVFLMLALTSGRPAGTTFGGNFLIIKTTIR
jgi:hypothetical protein